MIYVDGLRHYGGWRYGRSCHLFADGEAELHAFAAALGLKREWYQQREGLPHYDLTARVRALAVQRGAREVPAAFVAGFLSGRRAADPLPDEWAARMRVAALGEDVPGWFARGALAAAGLAVTPGT